MSTLTQHSLKSAKNYNVKASASVWGDQIAGLTNLIDQFPQLSNPHDSHDFVKGVRKVQKFLGCDVDGKLGRGTWACILKEFDYIDDSESFWTIGDRRVPCVHNADVKFINFDQQGGLDLHRFGHFSSRRGVKPRLIVVHWGGLNPKHCYNVFSDPNRKVSSHAGIGLTDSGDPAIYQYLDLGHKSWHAGWANGVSVGIDICQQPGIKWEKKYGSPYQVERIKNPTNRGPADILSIDPNVAKAVKHAINTLCDVLDIPKQCPRGVDGKATEGEIYHGVLDRDYLENHFTGVVGHHHISPKKWDCACWWDQIWL